jgi:hypothetical protein
MPADAEYWCVRTPCLLLVCCSDCSQSDLSHSASEGHKMESGNNWAGSETQPSSPPRGLLCCFYGMCIGPFAMMESFLRAFVNMYTGCLVCASLCIPGLSWWDRLELALEFFREGIILFALSFSFMIPGLPALTIADMDEEAGDWTFRPLPTICGSAQADRANAITCCFPHVRTFHPQYQDTCIPTGEDCIECCCSSRACDCCLRCCPRAAGSRVDPSYGGGRSSRGSPVARRGSISEIQVERSPGAMRRQSYLMRWRVVRALACLFHNLHCLLFVSKLTPMDMHSCWLISLYLPTTHFCKTLIIQV